MLTREQKDTIIKEFQTHAQDVGSSPVQVAVLTAEINELQKHFATHKKDYASRIGMMRRINRRKSLLAYIQKHSNEEYVNLITRLNLRK
jgi:small subunit ribosomal protein S15